MRELHRGSWEQTAGMFCFHHALDTDRHGRGPMRNLVRLGASNDLRERVFQDAEQLVGHFRFGPHERLQTLDPFEIGNDHAAGVAENIRNNEELVPTLVQNEICFGRGGSVRPFSENPALQFCGIRPVDDTIDRRRHEHVAWLVRTRSDRPGRLHERAQIALFDDVLFRFRHIDALWIVKGHRRVAYADDFYTGLEASDNAATEPTLPNPCTIAVHFSGFILSMSIARSMR